MKAPGLTIRDQEGALRPIKMEIRIVVTFSITNLMVKEYSVGLMAKRMKVSGNMERSTGMGPGNQLMVALILESGRQMLSLVMVFIFGSLVINTKANG